ncbi:hypothetical protein H4582DRAFT_1538383 [Lactarius indigo]|nr:hypothetical protein H4582DRAFT_1538383 [Lactarius indigo]
MYKRHSHSSPPVPFTPTILCDYRSWASVRRRSGTFKESRTHMLDSVARGGNLRSDTLSAGAGVAWPVWDVTVVLFPDGHRIYASREQLAKWFGALRHCRPHPAHCTYRVTVVVTDKLWRTGLCTGYSVNRPCFPRRREVAPHSVSAQRPVKVLVSREWQRWYKSRRHCLLANPSLRISPRTLFDLQSHLKPCSQDHSLVLAGPRAIPEYLIIVYMLTRSVHLFYRFVVDKALGALATQSDSPRTPTSSEKALD